jgi:TolB protein
MKTLLSAFAAAAGLAALAAPAGAADRLAAVSFESGGATVYTGSETELPTRRVFRGADRATLSPDARRLAYTRRVGGSVEIRVAGLSGAGERLVARVKPDDIVLAFSPDGARLAYSSAGAITIVSVAGASKRHVPLPRAWRGSRYSYAAFTPDGRRLVVSRTTGDGRAGTLKNELAVVQLSNGAAATLYASPNAYDQQARPTSFSPDGRYVAVDGTGTVLLAPTTPGEAHALVPRPRRGIDYGPLVSPDGRLVAFARAPDGGVSDVFVVGAQGTQLRRVTTTPIPPRGTPKVGAQPLAWSPDASKLLVFRHDRFEVVDVATRATTVLRRVGVRYAITSARWLGAAPQPSRSGTIVFSRTDDAGEGDLYTVRADGTALSRLTANRAGYDPAWSPDGRRIAFTAGSVRDRQLFTMAPDGSDVLRLTPSGGRRWAFNPSWHPGGPRGLRLVFDYAEPGTEDGDLWSIGSDGRTMTPLTQTPEREENGSFAPGGALVFEVSRGLRIRRDGHVTRLGEGSDPKWSPDGRRLVSVHHVGLRGGLIGVSNADGTGFRSLGWGSTPSWSPDGSSIVYSGGDGLYVVRADGLGLARRLTRAPRLSADLWPSWTA